MSDTDRDDIIECGCGHPAHPDGPCTGTGATLDAIYGIDPNEPCACVLSKPVD